MKKRILFILIISAICAVAFSLSACFEHVHVYTDTVVKPTCEERGYTLHTCTCGDEKKDNYVSAKGHVIGDWETTVQATCTEDGERALKCKNCGKAISTVSDPKTGHRFGEWVSDGNATETEDGTKTRKCVKCRQSETVVDEGSKLVNGISFSGFTKESDKIYKRNFTHSTAGVSFNSFINVKEGVTYEISKNTTGTPTVSKTNAPLNEGENVFYVFLSSLGTDSYFTVKIYRKHMYNVQFDTDGGNYISAQNIEEGGLATRPTDPTKTGHTFLGWDYDFNNPITQNITIKASWKVNKYLLTINYYKSGTTQKLANSYEQSIEYNTVYSVVSPTVEDYAPDKATVTGTMDESGKTVNVYYTEIYANYKTQYYVTEIEGGQPALKETTVLRGVIGTIVNASIKTFDDCTYNATKSTVSGTVTADGGLVLKVYYDKINNDALTWKTHTFSLSPISTSTETTVPMSSYYVSDINKFKIKYNLTEPVRCYLTIGSHTEDFFLEAGENKEFTSFTDDVLGDYDAMRNLESYHGSASVNAGATWSGYVSLKFKPIQKTTTSFKPITISFTKQTMGPSLITVQNQRFKMGTHLYYGGALTYFEDLTDGRDDIGNLVNANDGGRLVQQSYYGDDTESSGGVTYNPVQGGNGYGFSKLIDYEVSGTTIYIKARAKCWLSTNRYELSESYMENWYTICDDYALVKNTFVDFVDSNNVANVGECPAVYWVGGLDTLYVYEGTKSWTGDTLSRYEGGDGVNMVLSKSGHGHSWIDCTETWSAWVNDSGWGAGIYTPGAMTFTSWQADYDKKAQYGEYNPYSGYTSYIGMDANFTIRPFEKWEYSYMLTTGTVSEIRALFTENKDFVKNEFPAMYKDTYDLEDLDLTNKNTLKFTQRYHEAAAYYDDQRGVTKVVTLGTYDPYFGITVSTKNNEIFIDDYKYITLEYMIPAQFNNLNNQRCGFFFGVGTNEWVDPYHAVSTERTFVADGRWHTTYAILSKITSKTFTGKVNLVRFDFLEGDVNLYDYYYVKHIRFTNTIPNDNAYDDTFSKTRTWAESGDTFGKYGCAIDSFSPGSDVYNSNVFYATGWVLYNKGVNRFEWFVAEDGAYTETEVKGASLEPYWRYASVSARRARKDAANSYPDIGDNGMQAGFTLGFDLGKLPNGKAFEKGKTYKVYIRAIGNDDAALYLKTIKFTYTDES